MKHLCYYFFAKKICLIHANYACFASRWMAKHIYFIRKSVALHLCEGPDQGRTTDRIEKIRKKQDLNPRPPCPKASALPLCCNCCSNILFKFYNICYFIWPIAIQLWIPGLPRGGPDREGREQHPGVHRQAGGGALLLHLPLPLLLRKVQPLTPVQWTDYKLVDTNIFKSRPLGAT